MFKQEIGTGWVFVFDSGKAVKTESLGQHARSRRLRNQNQLTQDGEVDGVGELKTNEAEVGRADRD